MNHRKLIIFTRVLMLYVVFSLTLLLNAQETANARVIDMWEQLNVRAEPANQAAVVAEVAGRTPLTVLTRTRDNRWYQVQLAGGEVGWAAAGYITLDGEIWQIPIAGESSPTTAPDQPEQPPQAAAPAQSAGARVASSAYGGLNLRDAANGNIIGNLPAGTPLTVLGEQGGWLNVQTGDQIGWVSARYVTRSAATEITTTNTVTQPDPAAPLPQGVTAIYQRGRELGNVANNFSRVGDSITASDLFLYPIGHGVYDLGGYGHLQAAIDFFAGSTNSFLHQPIAARGGWTAADVLNPDFAPAGRCEAGETPLACEYRTIRPSIALIMFGTNDSVRTSTDDYAVHLDQIVQFSIANGVIPVLSTIPPRTGVNVGGFNAVIQATAARYGVPVWDYHSVMASLPNNGLSADGIHPSVPSGDFSNAATFAGDALTAGYVQRNLGALQILHQLMRDVVGN